MKYSIILSLDKGYQDKINCVREMLKNAGGGNDDVCIINHITLFSVETQDENAIEEIKKYIGEIADKQRQLSVTFVSAGTFLNDFNVIFLNPIMTSELKGLQKNVGASLGKFAHKGHYDYDNWTPHSTIAININDDTYFNYLKLLKQHAFLPIKAMADKIIITQYDVLPGRQLAEYHLKSHF